jgi:GTP-binding protein
VLLNELKTYNPELLDKKRILAVSKSDMLDEELKQALARESPEGLPHVFVSSVAQQGLTELKDLIWQTLHEKDVPAAEKA